MAAFPLVGHHLVTTTVLLEIKEPYADASTWRVSYPLAR